MGLSPCCRELNHGSNWGTSPEFEGESNQLPKFYENIIQRDLGAWWQWLPKSALSHDANAYLHKEMNKSGQMQYPGVPAI